MPETQHPPVQHQQQESSGLQRLLSSKTLRSLVDVLATPFAMVTSGLAFGKHLGEAIAKREVASRTPSKANRDESLHSQPEPVRK